MGYTSKISFPGLGIDQFEVSNIAFTIPGLDLSIMWYALIITFGMICCILYVVLQARKIGMTIDDVIDYALFTIPIGVIGARLYYVIFDTANTYDSIIDVFNIRQGGLAIYGGIIAGTLTVVAVSYFKKIKFFAFGDCVAPGVLLAQGIGRWGNFMNGEAYGSQTDSFLRMGLSNLNVNYDIMKGEIVDVSIGQMAYVHPTFLYESLWNLTGVLLVYLYARFIHKKYDGQLILLTFGWYGLGRMFIEGLRADSLFIGDTGIRVSQLLAGIIFFTFLGMLIFFAIRKPKAELYVKPAPVEGENKKSDITFGELVDKIKNIFSSKKGENEASAEEQNDHQDDEEL